MIHWASALNPQVCLLKHQIQQYLDYLNLGQFEVRTDSLWLGREWSDDLNPRLSVFNMMDMQPMACWVIEVIGEEALGSLTECSRARWFKQRSQLYASLEITDYWLFSLPQVELRTYDSPAAIGYRHQRLRQVGAQASPTVIPEIALTIQEPLPLYFLTRTLKGQRTYVSGALPLQVSTLSRTESP